MINIGNYNLLNCYYYVLILSIRGLAFPLVNTKAKLMMIDHYILPHKYMLFKGLFELIIFIIITPILIDNSKFHYSNDYWSYKLIAAFIYMITYSLKSFFLLTIMYHYSSLSVSFLIIAESFSGSIYGIIKFIKDEEYRSKGLNIAISSIEIICIISIVITTMIYEGIIIIKKYNLDENVDEENNKRANNDVNMALENSLMESTIFENKK